MPCKYILLAFLFLLHIFSTRGVTQKGCEIKHAVYNIVCSRFEFWCTTKRNVLTYEAICRNITLGEKTALNLNTPEKILDIEIFNSNIPILTANMFIDYPNIARLYVQTGTTREIATNAFKKNTILDWLILKNNNITTIQPKAFTGLSKLNVLNMNLNGLTELKDSTFEGLISLQYLSLKENKIAIIQDNTFANMKKLGVLFLNDNLLTVINEKTFANNVGLRITWFQNNKIKSIPDNFFKNKPLLNELILDYNNLVFVNYEGFNGNISMNHNKINKVLPVGTLSTDYFDISFNNISFIPANMLASSDNLTTLLLNNNSIDGIHEDAFRNLTMLQTLRLDNNQIIMLSLGLFRDLKSLVTLDLSYNQIQHIESGTFTGLINLNFLDLSNNIISIIQISALYPLKQLRIFYFNNNSLLTIDFDNLILHLISLKELNLDDNLWGCDWLSTNLIRLDSKGIKIVHGNSLTTANVHGISCDNSEFNETKIALIVPPPELIDDKEIIVKKNGKPEKALHSDTKTTSSSGYSANIHILTACGVFLFVLIVGIIVKKYFIKRKFVIRRIQSNDTVSYKLDLVDE